MLAKALEIRDEGTLIPALAVDMNPSMKFPNGVAQRALLKRCGYPCDQRANILLTALNANGTAAWNDPYAWGNRRSWAVAHHYILDHWHDLKDGDVVDVQFILGETTERKISEVQT